VRITEQPTARVGGTVSAGCIGTVSYTGWGAHALCAALRLSAWTCHTLTACTSPLCGCLSHVVVIILSPHASACHRVCRTSTQRALVAPGLNQRVHIDLPAMQVAASHGPAAPEPDAASGVWRGRCLQVCNSDSQRSRGQLGTVSRRRFGVSHAHCGVADQPVARCCLVDAGCARPCARPAILP
jgi:hypothetical protein